MLKSIFNLDLDEEKLESIIDNLDIDINNRFHLYFLFLFSEDRVKVNDLKEMINSLRNLVYKKKDINLDPRELLIRKLSGENIREIPMTDNFNLEKVLVYDMLNDIGVEVDEEIINKIFIDERGKYLITTNYYNIDIDYRDRLGLDFISMKDSELRKARQLDALLKLDKTYNRK